MPSSTHVEILRREDFLALEVELVNLAIAGPPPRLVRQPADDDAFIVVRFAPQHVVEEAYPENTAPGPVPVRGVVTAGFVQPVPDRQVVLTRSAALSYDVTVRGPSARARKELAPNAEVASASRVEVSLQRRAPASRIRISDGSRSRRFPRSRSVLRPPTSEGMLRGPERLSRPVTRTRQTCDSWCGSSKNWIKRPRRLHAARRAVFIDLIPLPQ
jgi:hypothetical protein